MVASIRKAVSIDCEGIRDIHLAAFPENESGLVATLAERLLTERTSPETISLVAEVDSHLVGHIAFSPLAMESNAARIGYVLAPLGVRPEYQGAGVGAKLVEAGRQMLSDNGVDMLFVYGDPAYYGRFGFDAELASHFLPPYELTYPFGWQAMALRDGVSDVQPCTLSCVAALRDPALW